MPEFQCIFIPLLEEFGSRKSFLSPSSPCSPLLDWIIQLDEFNYVTQEDGWEKTQHSYPKPHSYVNKHQ